MQRTEKMKSKMSGKPSHLKRGPFEIVRVDIGPKTRFTPGKTAYDLVYRGKKLHRFDLRKHALEFLEELIQTCKEFA